MGIADYVNYRIVWLVKQMPVRKPPQSLSNQRWAESILYIRYSEYTYHLL